MPSYACSGFSSMTLFEQPSVFTDSLFGAAARSDRVNRCEIVFRLVAARERAGIPGLSQSSRDQGNGEARTLIGRLRQETRLPCPSPSK
jgi:hypothetical protein